MFNFINYFALPGNKENYITYCREYVSQQTRKSRPYFLFTSRDKNCLPNVSSLNIGVLNKTEAVELIENEFRKNGFTQDREDVEKLAENVQYFPLALQQAIAYIREQRESVFGNGYDIQEYLKEFKIKQKLLLNHKYSDDFGTYGETTFITWNVTFDAINSHNEDSETVIKILQFLAYLYADEVDPHMLLSYFSDSNSLGRAIKLLERYSVVTKIEEKNFYQIHRLVQAVMRIKFESQKKKILEKTVRLINPEAVAYYLSTKNFFKKMFWSNYYIDNYVNCIEKCTLNQAIHMNTLSTHFKDHKKLYEKYEKLFQDISERGFINAVFNDNIDKLKVLDKSNEFLKEFVENNVEKLVESKCNKFIKYSEEKGCLNVMCQSNCFSPLYYAAKYENLEILKFLLEKGVNANIKSADNQPLIMKFYKNIKIFCLLLPKTNIQECVLNESIHFSQDFCEAFLKESTDVNLPSVDGHTLLHIICKSSHDSVEEVKFLVENGMDIDATSNDGKTALSYAVIFNKNNIFKYLITKSKSVDEEILILAIKCDNLSIVKVLFEKYFTTNYRFKDGKTSFKLAVKHFSIIVILAFFRIEFTEYLKQGGNINMKNDKGETLLILFVKNSKKQDFEKLEYLIDNGINVDAMDSNGKTALYYAFISNYFAIYMFLLSKSNSVDEEILFLAIKDNNLFVVEALLEEHFSVDYRFKDGTTPLEVANNYNRKNILLLLNKNVPSDKSPRKSLNKKSLNKKSVKPNNWNWNKNREQSDFSHKKNS